MTAVELDSLLTDTCAKLGVTTREARWGTSRVTTGGRAWAQYSVSLARSLFLFRAWSEGATATQAAQMLRLTPRSVRHWFADFRARRAGSPPKGMRRAAA